MLYIGSTGHHMFVLEPANLARVLDGEAILVGSPTENFMYVLEPAKAARLLVGEAIVVETPTEKIILTYTPDMAWLRQQLVNYGDDVSTEELDELLTEGQKRDPVMRDEMRGGTHPAKLNSA